MAASFGVAIASAIVCIVMVRWGRRWGRRSCLFIAMWLANVVFLVAAPRSVARGAGEARGIDPGRVKPYNRATVSEGPFRPDLCAAALG
jgi:hypothetical protein